MKKLIVLMLSLLLLTGILVGCGKSNLPVKTIEWEMDQDGFVQFYTNDENWCEATFYTSFKFDPSPLDVFEVEMKKISGCANYGYGLLFCYKDKDNYYRLLIDTTGYFSIYKVSTKNEITNYEPIFDWRESSYLNTGYNVINKIKIEQDQDILGNFSIYFNDHFITS